MSLHEYGLNDGDVAAIEEMSKLGVKMSFIKQLLMKSHVKGFREGISESISFMGSGERLDQFEGH